LHHFNYTLLMKVNYTGQCARSRHK
jgi:hypothetical protein